MKIIFLAIALLLAAISPVFCQEAETTFNFKAPFHLASLVAQADSVTIEFRAGKENAETSFIDPEWNQKLSAILRGAIYEPQSHCFCYSTPIIRFKKNGAQVLQLSVHHGEKLRASSNEISGDFVIGTDACSKIAALASLKQPLASATAPTPPKTAPQK